MEQLDSMYCICICRVVSHNSRTSITIYQATSTIYGYGPKVSHIRASIKYYNIGIVTATKGGENQKRRRV